VRLEECQLPAALPKALLAAIESIQREDLFPSYEDGLRRILRVLHAEKRTGVFEETFSCLGPDNAGWRLGDWQLHEADHHRREQPLASCRRQGLADTASAAGGAPDRRDRDRAAGPAADAALPPPPSALGAGRRRGGIPRHGRRRGRRRDLPGRGSRGRLDDLCGPGARPGARRATLELAVTISSSLNYFPTAAAWVDDLRIA
jgi:hypothetical protein